MKMSKETIKKARLLALAYIKAKAGDAEAAGEAMVEACEGTELDPIMHGVAEGLGFTEDDEEEAADDVEIEDDEMSASAEDEDDDEADVDSLDDVEADDAEADNAEAEEAPAKVAVPASVVKLANLKY